MFVQGTTTQVDSTTINLADNVLQLNAAGTSDGGIIVRDATGGSIFSGSLLWDVTNDYWKAGKSGSESQILVADGMGVVSGSSQITISSTTGFTTFSSSIDTLNSLQTTRIDQLAAGTASVNSYTSSVYAKFSTLQTLTASMAAQVSRLQESTASLNLFSSSTLTRLSRIEESTSSLNTFSSSALTRLGNLETSGSTALSTNNAQDLRLTNLESTSASVNTLNTLQTTRIDQIAASTASVNLFSSSALTRFSRIEESTSSLNSFTSSINTTIKTQLNVNTVVSSSSQVDITGTTNYSTFSSSIATSISASVSAGAPTFANITGKPAGLVSGSSQIVLNDADKTGFDTTDVPEGTRLYYTDTRVAAKVTDAYIQSTLTLIDGGTY